MIKKLLNKKKLLLLVSFFYLFTNVNIYGMEKDNINKEENNQVQQDSPLTMESIYENTIKKNKESILNFIKEELLKKNKEIILNSIDIYYTDEKKTTTEKLEKKTLNNRNIYNLINQYISNKEEKNLKIFLIKSYKNKEINDKNILINKTIYEYLFKIVKEYNTYKKDTNIRNILNDIFILKSKDKDTDNISQNIEKIATEKKDELKKILDILLKTKISSFEEIEKLIGDNLTQGKKNFAEFRKSFSKTNLEKTKKKLAMIKAKFDFSTELYNIIITNFDKFSESDKFKDSTLYKNLEKYINDFYEKIDNEKYKKINASFIENKKIFSDKIINNINKIIEKFNLFYKEKNDDILKNSKIKDILKIFLKNDPIILHINALFDKEENKLENYYYANLNESKKYPDMNKTFENLKTYAKEISNFLKEYNIENFYKKNDKYDEELIIEDSKKLIEHNSKIEVTYIEHTIKEEIELLKEEIELKKEEIEKNKKENNSTNNTSLENDIKTKEKEIEILEKQKIEKIKEEDLKKEKGLKEFEGKLKKDKKSFKDELNLKEEIEKLINNFATLHKDEYNKIMNIKSKTTTTTAPLASSTRAHAGGGAKHSVRKGAPVKRGGITKGRKGNRSSNKGKRKQTKKSKKK